jgi:hypothetical protein
VVVVVDVVVDVAAAAHEDATIVNASTLARGIKRRRMVM